MARLVKPRRLDPKRAALGGLTALAIGLHASPAVAAGYAQVTGFGDNPNNLNMYVYEPAQLAPSPPLVVVIHYCGGSAQAMYTGYGSGLVTAANQHGFVLVFPETVSSVNNKCWDVYSSATFKHDGGGDSLGIVTMVKYALTKYGADPQRIYAMGVSSGAMMTQVLLGAYPDLFKAGAEWAGVPFGCFAGNGYWNSACATGASTKSAKEWGDLVRAGYPAYLGARPRIQLWHGDQDDTIDFNNFGESIKQWTNVFGLSEAATTTEQNAPQANNTRTRYEDECGNVQVEAVKLGGQGHSVSIQPGEMIRFFGLDQDTDPGPAPCGAGGTGGAGGGGVAGAAGLAGAGGGSATAGNGGVAGSGTPGGGGSPAGQPGTAGQSQLGGAAGASTATGGTAVAGPAAPGSNGADDMAASGSDGSCACRLAPTGAGPSVWWLTLALAISACRRRLGGRARLAVTAAPSGPA